VKPVLSEHFDNQAEMFENGFKAAIREMNLKPGDKVVMTGGDIGGEPGNTNVIKVETVK
jgi:pyruvate kinase